MAACEVPDTYRVVSGPPPPADGEEDDAITLKHHGEYSGPAPDDPEFVNFVRARWRETVAGGNAHMIISRRPAPAPPPEAVAGAEAPRGPAPRVMRTGLGLPPAPPPAAPPPAEYEMILACVVGPGDAMCVVRYWGFPPGEPEITLVTPQAEGEQKGAAGFRTAGIPPELRRADIPAPPITLRECPHGKEPKGS